MIPLAARTALAYSRQVRLEARAPRVRRTDAGIVWAVDGGRPRIRSVLSPMPRTIGTPIADRP